MKPVNLAFLGVLAASISADGHYGRKRKIGHGLSKKKHTRRKKKSHPTRASRRANR